MSQGVYEAFELTVFIFVFILYIAGVGVNPGNLPCTTCVRPGCKRYTVCGIQGGDFEIKIYKINSFSLFYFMSKMLKIHCMEYNQLNGTYVADVEDLLKYMYSSHTCILHRSVDV